MTLLMHDVGLANQASKPDQASSGAPAFLRASHSQNQTGLITAYPRSYRAPKHPNLVSLDPSR